MNKDNVDDDTLQPEYDFTKMKVSKMGAGRKNFGNQVVRLEPDVAEMFPTADAVNEALRLLVRVMQKKTAGVSD